MVRRRLRRTAWPDGLECKYPMMVMMRIMKMDMMMAMNENVELATSPAPPKYIDYLASYSSALCAAIIHF